MRINQITENFRKTPLDIHKQNLVKIAQKEYDVWDESDTDTYANGGICHFIADEFSDYFNNKGFISYTISATHMQHVSTIVLIQKPKEDEENVDEFYEVDIDPFRYESGGGFNWCKIHGIEFDNNDIKIQLLFTGKEGYYNTEVTDLYYDLYGEEIE